MKRIVFTLLFLLTINQVGIAQSPWVTTMRNEISDAKSDTSRALSLAELSNKVVIGENHQRHEYRR